MGEAFAARNNADHKISFRSENYSPLAFGAKCASRIQLFGANFIRISRFLSLIIRIYPKSYIFGSLYVIIEINKE